MASLTIAWIVLGVGMAMGLYDPAFAALTRLYGRAARAPITGITLIAGFASTIGWPASAWFEHEFGWREACLIWAALNLLVAMPLNWWPIPPAPPLPAASAASRDAVEPEAPRGAMPILAFFFSATRFVSGAFSAHLPGLLQGAGATEIAAIAAGALVGPAQVGARLVEFGLLRSFHPLVSARIAAVLHPIGAGFLVVFGPVAAPRVRDLSRRRQRHDHDRQGHAAAWRSSGRPDTGCATACYRCRPALPKPAAPLLFGLLLDRIGVIAVLVSAGLCLAAFASLLLLRLTRRAAPAAAAAASD